MGTEESDHREKAVSHEKAQKAQKRDGFALTETFTEWVTTVSTPSFSFCAFCAFSRPSTAVFSSNCFLHESQPEDGGTFVMASQYRCSRQSSTVISLVFFQPAWPSKNMMLEPSPCRAAATLRSPLKTRPPGT